MSRDPLRSSTTPCEHACSVTRRRRCPLQHFQPLGHLFAWERLCRASKQAPIALEDGLKALKTPIIPMRLPRWSPACSLSEIRSISLFFSSVFHWVHAFLHDFWVKIASHVRYGFGFVQTDVPVTSVPPQALGFG